MLEIKTIQVKLGEREYTIRQAGFRRSRPWKERLLEEVKPVFEQIAQIEKRKFNTIEEMLELLPVAQSILVDSMENMGDLLLAYSPELEADKEYIEEYATDAQVFQAFQEVLQLMDFFGAIPLMNEKIGQMKTGTSSSLPSANGDSRRKKPQGSQTTK